MAIAFACTGCRQQLAVDEQYLGQQVQCPSCKQVLTVPMTSSPPNYASNYPGKPLDLHELQQQNPYAAPQAPLQSANAYQNVGHNLQHQVIVVGDVLATAWNVFKQRWSSMLVMMLLSFGVNLIPNLLFQFAANAWQKGGMSFLVLIPIYLIVLAVSIYLYASQISFCLRVCRGGGQEVNEIFQGGPYVLRIAGLLLLFYIALLAIALLAAVPVSILAVVLGADPAPFIVIAIGFIYLLMIVLLLWVWPALYLIVDHELGVLESVRVALRLTRENRLSVFGLMLLIIVIGIVSFITCIGPFVVFGMFVPLLTTVVYLRMSGQPIAYQPNTPGNWTA